MSVFGKEVRKALIDMDLKSADLARAAGVSRAYVCRVLTGVTPPSEAVMQGLRALGIGGHAVTVGYAMAVGSISVAGLTRSQVSDVVLAVSRTREGRN